MAVTAKAGNDETVPAAATRAILPLVAGDRLSRVEFERRYHAMPHVKKAELIEGVVYMPSPVNHRKHGEPHARVIRWLGRYADETPHIEISDNATVRLDMDNEPQPDAQMLISDEGFIEGAPELGVEISASSASYDLHDKKHAFRRNGVLEYLVWLTEDRRIVWWRLEGGAYVEIEPGDDGIMKSRAFPGLWLEPEALLAGEAKRVNSVVDAGIDSAEHAAFCAKLEAVAGKSRRH